MTRGIDGWRATAKRFATWSATLRATWAAGLAVVYLCQPPKHCDQKLGKRGTATLTSAIWNVRSMEMFTYQREDERCCACLPGATS